MSFSGNGMELFQYTALPARGLFGFGTIAKVADELVSLGRKRAFVLSDPHHARGTSISGAMRYSGSSHLSSSVPG
jgi:alcohol dehydrogenase class IV